MIYRPPVVRARAASVRALGKEHEAREDEEKAEELAAQEAQEEWRQYHESSKVPELAQRALL
jgi:hypothetical protein